jgi:adenosylcobinamide-GDP ribazoletransferase
LLQKISDVVKRISSGQRFFQCNSESWQFKNVSGFCARHRAHVNAIKDLAPAMNDPASFPNPKPSAGFRPVAELVHSAKFLTRVPIPFSRTLDAPPLAETMRMFSVIGALLGCAIAMVLLAGRYLHLPDHLSAILAVAFGLLLTGALHEDGLADTADGLGGGKTRERRLEIMRDSRIGTYGALALFVAVGARAACFAAIVDQNAIAVVVVLAASQSFSRAMVVDLLWATRPARLDGLSAYAGQPRRSVAMFAIAVGLFLTLLAGSFTSFENAVLALGIGLAATASIRAAAIKLLGGQTGDICGATQVTCEIVMLTAFLTVLY